MRLANAIHGFQARADLIRLDALAADFHLIIDPAEEMEHAVFIHRSDIAGAIPSGDSGSLAGDKNRSRRLRALQIAKTHSRAAEPQLARSVRWRGPPRSIHDPNIQSGQWTSDRRIRAIGGNHQRRGRGDDGRLGGAVGVENRNATAASPPPRVGGTRAGFFTADDDGAHTRWRTCFVRIQPGAPTGPIGGRQVGDGDAVRDEKLLIALEGFEDELLAGHQAGSG